MNDSQQDYHNFSTSSEHRLPTISGVEAIKLAIQNSRPISTGLTTLDAILASFGGVGSSPKGGIQRGVVTEIYGPPGVGKTTFALQLAVNALCGGNGDASVMWIDTSSTLVPGRLRTLMDEYAPLLTDDIPSSPPELLKSRDELLRSNFKHLRINNLHTLLTLFMHPMAGFPVAGTSLLVLDDLSNFLLHELPRTSMSTNNSAMSSTPTTIRKDAIAKQATTRRFQIFSNFASALQKFAAARNVAIVVTSKATANLRVGQKAALRSALTSQQWNGPLSARVFLYRDFWPDEINTIDAVQGRSDDSQSIETLQRTFRYAQVVRKSGKEVVSQAVGFVVSEGGIRDVGNHDQDVRVLPVATQSLPNFGNILNGEDARDEPLNPKSELIESFETKVENQGITDQGVHEPLKRKATEIADSEDEENFELDEPASLQPPGVQLPVRSELGSQDERQSLLDEPPLNFQTAKKVRVDANHESNADGLAQLDITNTAKIRPSTINDNDDGEVMLLEEEHSQIPAFSQAAAEMSDPLTPSDHGGGSP